MEEDMRTYPQLAVFRPYLSEAEYHRLDICAFRPREPLLKEGDAGPHRLYFVLRGVCVNDMVYPLVDYQFVARKVLPGEFVGLQEIIAPKPKRRVTSVLAKTEVEALAIPGAEVLRWQHAHPKLYNTIVYSVLSKHFDTRTLNMNCAAQDAMMAGAYYLHYLYGAYAMGCHQAGYAGPVKIVDTRQEIGIALAKDVRSVDRIISEFRGLGYIDVQKGKVYIDKRQAALLEDYVLQRQ